MPEKTCRDMPTRKRGNNARKPLKHLRREKKNKERGNPPEFSKKYPSHPKDSNHCSW